MGRRCVHACTPHFRVPTLMPVHWLQAYGLRRQICSFIDSNPNLMISDSPMKEWVLWDSGSSVSAYSRRMAQGSVWGGGIEMAAVAHMKRCNVFVYQANGGGFKRISSFEFNPQAKVVRVLYGGGSTMTRSKLRLALEADIEPMYCLVIRRWSMVGLCSV